MEMEMEMETLPGQDGTKVFNMLNLCCVQPKLVSLDGSSHRLTHRSRWISWMAVNLTNHLLKGGTIQVHGVPE